MIGRKDIHKDGKKTQFSSTNQPENRRGKSLTTMIKKQLFDENEFIEIEGAEELDADRNPTGKKVNVRIAMIKAEHLVQHYLKRAKKSDIILKDAIDRIDGKALSISKIEHSGELQVENKYSHLTEEQIQQALENLDRLKLKV